MKAKFDIEAFNHIRNEYKTVNGLRQAIFITCFIQKATCYCRFASNIGPKCTIHGRTTA